MKIQKHIIALLILVIPAFAFAQEEVTIKKEVDEKSSFMKYNHDLGFSVGTVTGVGLSYRHWFNDTKLQNFGIQATFSPASNKDYQEYQGSLTFLLRLTDSKYASLFLYQANYIQYAEFDNPSSYYHEGFLEVDRTFSNGLGIGVEIVALKHLSINLMTGYHLDNVLNENNEYETSFGLKGEIGLFYKF